MFVIVYGSCSHSHFLTPPGHPSGGLLSPFSPFSPFYLSTQVPKLLCCSDMQAERRGRENIFFFSFRETLSFYPLPTNGNKKKFPPFLRDRVEGGCMRNEIWSFLFPHMISRKWKGINCLKDFLFRPVRLANDVRIKLQNNKKSPSLPSQISWKIHESWRRRVVVVASKGDFYMIF